MSAEVAGIPLSEMELAMFVFPSKTSASNASAPLTPKSNSIVSLSPSTKIGKVSVYVITPSIIEIIRSFCIEEQIINFCVSFIIKRIFSISNGFELEQSILLVPAVNV